MENKSSALRFKQVREELGFTQQAFAQKLGISTTADIERARTKISGHIVMQLLRDHQINPLWLFGHSAQKYVTASGRDTLPQTITVDNVGQENILLVNEKAAAGYADNLNNVSYYESLPAFSVPLPDYRNATFRGFQVEGYSMVPALSPDEWVIAKAVTNLTDIKSGQIYVIVENESLRVKRVIPNHAEQQLTLVSVNPDYPDDVISFHQVKELWEFHSKITKEITFQSSKDKLDAMHDDIKEIMDRL